jgi:hypothetical protein
LLKLDHNAQLPEKVAACGPTLSPAPMLRFTRSPRASPPEKR